MDNDGRMVVGSEKHKPYPSYKDSGVEGLRAIPGHWAVRKVTQLFSIGSGTTPPTDYSEYYGGKIPWITTSELRESVVTSTEKTITKKALETFPALNVYPEGSVAVAMYGATIGRLGVLGTSATVNQACCVFSVPRQIDAWFWFYWLQSRRPYLISLGYGGGQPNLSQELIKSIRVPTPPLNEQRAIAAFLDPETAKIDALVAKKERLIELLQEKRTALFTRAVSKGLDPDIPMKDSGIEWLGEIPQHWTVKKLRRWASLIQTGSTPPTDQPQYFSDGTVPWHGPSSFSTDLLLRPAVRMVTEGAIRQRMARLFHKGSTMIVTIGATLGRVGFIEEPSSCNQQITVVTFDSTDVNNKYAAYQLKRLEPILAGIAPNTTLPILDQWQIGDLPFAGPPLNEQRVITTFLDRETTKIDTLVAKVHLAIDHLKELRTALISAAVTGKIDVRAAADANPRIAS